VDGCGNVDESEEGNGRVWCMGGNIIFFQRCWRETSEKEVVEMWFLALICGGG